MSKVFKKAKKLVKKVGETTLDVVTLGQKETIEGVVKGVTGIAAAEAAEEQANIAKRQAAAQQADIAAQEKLIAEEQAKQDKVRAERAGRMSKNLLLTGAETGVTRKTSLLG